MYHRKKTSWGFPKWGDYGQDRDATTVRICDRAGCSEKADHPAPKAPQSPEKWWFCEVHAAEYNRSWNFFEGMSDADAAQYAKEESAAERGFSQSRSNIYGWGGAADESGFSATEKAALAALDLDTDADWTAVKKNYRRLAKELHPDRNPGDSTAQDRFQEVRAAYDLLKLRFAGR